MFVNPSEWGQHHLFESISVWNVPLVKPHFSCMVDARLVLHGYDVAAALNGWFEAFQRGAKCERGFIDIDRSMLPIKPYVEFGEAVGKPMPDIENYKVSVMYRSFYGDANLFSISLPTVIKHFPKAYEVVVVVEERDRELFRELIDPYVDSSPFPIRLRAEPSLMDGNIQQKYSKVSAYLYPEESLFFDWFDIFHLPLVHRASLLTCSIPLNRTTAASLSNKGLPNCRSLDVLP